MSARREDARRKAKREAGVRERHPRMGDVILALQDAPQHERSWSSDRYAAEVRDDERTAAQLAISAVPFFVVDRAIGSARAHPPEQLLELLRQPRAANPPTAVAAGETCAADGC